jgi:NAD(P)-dependent dehydrogenase (short-subunit alcohol dehydrogenase family)
VDAIQSFGRVDLVVNNASTLGATPLPGLLDYSMNSLEEVYRVNVFAPLAILQAVKHFLKQDAVIVNITSDAGREAYPDWGAYGSSKAALEHLSAVMSVENPDLHIYWVDPGDMRTKMKQDSDPDEDISSLPLPDQVVPGFMEIIQGELPSGRYQAQEL